MEGIKRRSALFFAVGGVLALAAACGGRALVSVPPTVSPTFEVPSMVPSLSSGAPATPDLPPPPTDIPTPRGASPTPPGGEHGGPHSDPDLEARLPVTVAGIVLTRTSMTPAEFVTDANSASFAAFLMAVGRPEDDVTMAVGVDRTGSLNGSITGLRAIGARSEDLLSGVLALSSGQPTLSNITVEGLQVVKAEFATAPTQYIYIDGDTAFVVVAGDEATAILFLSALGRGDDQ